jgi:hypothetical protein
VTPLQRLARRLGYDLTPRTKAKSPHAQLVAVLAHFRITCVLDVGANVGQYGAMLRAWGYPGRIVSFEPQAGAHGALVRRAAADPAWQVAPPVALGARNGRIELEVSAESVDTQGYEPAVLAGAAGLLERLAGIQLEMSLVPLYEGERAFRAMLDDLAALGFEPYLFLPGYFERKLARQFQVDGVFMRTTAAGAEA